MSTLPYRFFRCHNEHMKKTAFKYMQSVLSLVKTGPDRASLAYTLWVNCALPAILYGCEVIPVTKDTLEVIERCQSRIGKFILQIPSSSSNAAVHIDAGLRPVWAVLAEKVVGYASTLLDKPNDYWARLALVENINMGSRSSYTTYLNKWKDIGNGYGVDLRLIKKNVRSAAINGALRLQHDTLKTTFAMNAQPLGKAWFHPKAWVSDSGLSKTFAEFRVCNASLGNRGPTRDGRYFKLCPLCERDNIIALNNEVHMVFDCPSMARFRWQCEVGRFKEVYRRLLPQISSNKLCSLFLMDSKPDSNLKEQILSLYFMHSSWSAEVGID